MRQISHETKLNNDQYQSSVDPIGIVIGYKPSSTFSTGQFAGYVFGNYSRQVSVQGNNENLFWDFCEPCPLYQKQLCSGGYKVLKKEPDIGTFLMRNGEGSRIEVKYYKEFCQMHHGTTRLRNSLTADAVINARLHPHIFFIRDTVPYWFVYRPNPNGDGIQLLPYRIFNTYGSGKICLGDTPLDTRSSIPHVYEAFLSSKMNRDLNPTNYLPREEIVNPIDWIRMFTPELLDQKDAESRWKTPQQRFEQAVFSILPPIYKRVRFYSVYVSELESHYDTSDFTTVKVTLPFMQDYEDRWFCILDTDFEITNTSAPSLYLDLP